MISNYKEKKKKVLSIYDEYKIMLNQIGESVSGKISSQVENIKNDKFILMVAGEAKSGKSTFINAYLGKEILPMDVKQCTSAIIEIYYSDNYELIAEYADKPWKRFKSESEIVTFLRANAALVDTYRDIPVTMINNELLIKYKGAPKEGDIKKLIEGVKNDNIYGLSEKEYESKIREYIKKEGVNWRDIVTKMRVGWPLDESMKGITIIDSPGVNAEGIVGKITEEYIENANAIMFIKSLNGQALESTSFKKFLESKSLDKHKDTMFLILTGTANLSEVDVNKLQAQASDMYKQIGKEKMICVDSKIQIILNECKSMKSSEAVGEYFAQMYEKKMNFDPAELCWMRSRNNKNLFEEQMLQKSNFMQVHESLEKFARGAQYLALSELLNSIETSYIKILDRLEEQISLHKEKLQDPKELEKKIREKKIEIEDIKRKMNSTIENIITNYTNDEDGIIIKKAHEAIKDFEEKLKFGQNDKSIDELEKQSLRKIEEFKNFRNVLGKAIIDECDKELLHLADGSQAIKFTFLEPEFSQDDFDNIKNNTESSAYETKEIEEGKTFKKTRQVSRYSANRHYDILKNSITDRLKTISNKVVSNLQDYTITTTKVYKEKLKANSEEKNKEYDKLLADKRSTEETLLLIKNYSQYIEQIGKQKEILDVIKGGIESNA